MRTLLVRAAVFLLAVALVVCTVPRSEPAPSGVGAAGGGGPTPFPGGTCDGFDDSGLVSNEPTRFATATAADVISGARRDVWVLHTLNGVAGVKGGPMEDPRAPRCHPEALELGVPVFVRAYPGTRGTWLVPVTYHGITLDTLYISRDADGRGSLGRMSGGDVPALIPSEDEARVAAGDPLQSVELVWVRLGCGSESPAWRLARPDGTAVYYVGGYRDGTKVNTLLREDEVTFLSGRAGYALSAAC